MTANPHPDPDRRLPATAHSAPSTSTPARSSFTLTGPSATLDARRDAARRDLADIRLASRVFAPHYAAPVSLVLATAADLRLSAERGSEVAAALPAGAAFEVLEVAGGTAWGTAPGIGLVGYLDAGALAPAAA